jgi:hypothetical protein
MAVSDRSYPTASLWALERALNWVKTEEGSVDEAGSFLTLLENMKYRTEFRPAHWSNEPPPMILGGELEYREPVWDIIHEVAAKRMPHPACTAAECATWLEDLLHQAVSHRVFRKHLADFTAKLAAAKLDVPVDFSACPQVVSWANAEELLAVILMELVSRMEAYVATQANRG